MPIGFGDVREMALALPGVEDGLSYGTPALKMRGRLLVRLKEDGATIVLRIGLDEREMLIAADPKAFFVTDHYRAYPSVLIRLAHVHPPTLSRLIAQAWRAAAPKRVVAEWDRQRGADAGSR